MFNETKTTQAAARLVEKAGGTMNYMVLVKMLYMVDRWSILQTGLPVTFDKFYTMKKGPILSVTLELISKPKNFTKDHPWLAAFKTNGYKIRLISPAGNSELSEFEERLIDGVFEDFKKYLDDEFGFPDWMHANLPEVKTIESGRKPLEVREILEAENRTEEQIQITLDDIRSMDLISAFAG